MPKCLVCNAQFNVSIGYSSETFNHSCECGIEAITQDTDPTDIERLRDWWAKVQDNSACPSCGSEQFVYEGGIQRCAECGR